MCAREARRSALYRCAVSDSNLVHDSSRAEQVHKAFTDLKKIGSSPGCGFKINHYQTPDSGDNKKWTTSGNADLWVDVKDADPEARITKANACFKQLREYILGLPKYDPGA